MSLAMGYRVKELEERVQEMEKALQQIQASIIILMERTRPRKPVRKDEQNASANLG